MSRPDPFRRVRREGALRCSFAGSDMTLLLRQTDLERTAGDYQRFSAEPDARAEQADRMLPLQSEPPDHRDYRRLLMPFFTRPHGDEMVAQIGELTNRVVERCLALGAVEIVTELALPLQSHALAILFGLPDDDAREWMTWGTQAQALADAPESGVSPLDAYIDRKLRQATSGPDLFGHLACADYRGRSLTHAEMRSLVRLAFRSGGEPLLSLIANAIDWLASHPEDLERLRDDPSLAPAATEEFVRYFSPLSHTTRIARHDSVVNGMRVRAGSRVSLCWAAANRDDAAFASPDELRIDRHPNRHLGFGRGHHACPGAAHTRLVMQCLLRAVGRHVGSIAVVNAEPIVEHFGDIDRHAGFRQLLARLTAR